jgi:hypothetical protein
MACQEEKPRKGTPPAKLREHSEPVSLRRSLAQIILSSLLPLALVCFFSTGCNAPTVWEQEVRSPDGTSIAIARTVQGGGFGTASIDTTVFLKTTRYSNAPMQVLGFSCQGPVPKPYVLDNVANAGGTISLKVTWLSPSKLEVTYSGHPDLYLQVAKIWGIEVSLRSLDAPASPSRRF